MEPKFVTLPEMKIVGLGAKFVSILSPDKNNMTVIPELWHRFINRIGEIPNRKDMNSLGLVEDLPKGTVKANPDELFYVACAQVTSLDSIPAGMISRTIPAGKYASFTHKGKLDGLGQTMHAIYRVWLPKSGVKLRNAPHVEWYDERFDPGSDKSEFDTLLPV